LLLAELSSMALVSVSDCWLSDGDEEQVDDGGDGGGDDGAEGGGEGAEDAGKSKDSLKIKPGGCEVVVGL